MTKDANVLFAVEAPKYWEKGLSGLPVKPGSKQPSIGSWSSFQANLPSETRKQDWISKFGNHGIGVNTGSEIMSGQMLVGIDIDDDVWTRFCQRVIGGTLCAKRGKKGLTIFARAAKSGRIKSTTLRGANGFGNIDVLAGGRFTVLPPTIHPDILEPYQWVGDSLLTVRFEDLPEITEHLLSALACVIASKHAPALIFGKQTHDAGVALVAELVSKNLGDREIRDVIIGLLPDSYSGNSLEELDGWIASARAKGFDQRGRRLDYDPGATGPVPLGFTKDGLFVLRDQIRSIILMMTSNQLLSHQVLIGLAPSEFWLSQFAKKEGGFSPSEAGEAVIVTCRNRGPFDSRKVRGNGLWSEDGQIVKNLGEPLRDGLKYMYLSFSAIPIAETEEFDAKGLRALLRRFPFKDPNNADLLFGWAALAPLAGALDWRPHFFLYGPPNSGKTTLHNLVSRILTPMVVAADGQSTEAGIRQSLGPDALPVILDEFETDSNQTRLQGIMRLARSASSTESPLLRGTPEGRAVQFSIRTMFLFSAVNVVGMTPADQTRITVAELQAHDSDPQVAAKIEREFADFAGLGPQWCGYMVALAPKVMISIPIIKEAMGAYESRLRQTMASLLAGMFVAMTGRVPNTEEAVELANQYQPTINQHRIDQDRDNALECLEHFLAHPVRGDDVGEFPIGHWLAVELRRLRSGQAANGIAESERIVAGFQVKFCLGGDQEGLLIRNGAPPVDRVFRGTKWADGAWRRALGQLPGVFKLSGPQAFPGVSGKHRSVGLPLSMVPDAFDDIERPEMF